MIADAPGCLPVIEIDLVSALLVLVGAGVGVTFLVSKRGRRQQVPGGSGLYRLTRGMAHALEGVLLLDDSFTILPSTQRSSIEALLKEWEKQL